ncbi:spore coat protein [Paenibacillus hodogayensis]|uniref:Spore coat protein n=1 Tax=Paenibacillus hodogayensis TaxID=279208 RepID=A0ABV5W8H6_9BACL
MYTGTQQQTRQPGQQSRQMTPQTWQQQQQQASAQWQQASQHQPNYQQQHAAPQLQQQWQQQSNQQSQQQQQNATFMEDQDLLYTILCDLKRTCREYTTAATESNCPAVRQMFTQLLNETLNSQGQLYQLMSQLNMYNTSSPALRQEVDKQSKQYTQSGQKTSQFVQQKLSAAGKQAQPGVPFAAMSFNQGFSTAGHPQYN